MSEASGVFAEAAKLGIDVSSLDEDSDFGGETESTEAEGEATEEVVNEEGAEISDEDDDADLEQTDGEENQEAQEKPVAEKPQEEPKLTAKEHQELQVAREELAKERQAFMDQKAQVEKEFHEKYHDKLQAFDDLDAFLIEYEANDPDAFSLFKTDYQKHQKQYSNPIINSLKTQIDTLSKELGQFKSTASDQVTITKMGAEMNQFKSTIGKEAEAAGLKVDYSKVEDMWADNPKMTLEQCFYALHGANFAKAMQSKAKVFQVEKKVEGRPSVPTAGSVKRSNAPVSEKVPMKADDAVRFWARKLSGK